MGEGRAPHSELGLSPSPTQMYLSSRVSNIHPNHGTTHSSRGHTILNCLESPGHGREHRDYGRIREGQTCRPFLPSQAPCLHARTLASSLQWTETVYIVVWISSRPPRVAGAWKGLDKNIREGQICRLFRPSQAPCLHARTLASSLQWTETVYIVVRIVT
ncbi:hypothetical protein RRG08_002455 [Elysia crispata]|uniref:Uncharacterized protein n=1 Tax=Elysia crispata TaxID=231223 RepID=A0AAE1DTU2_9GAST|nr:hypothetical protein RRG08_002455 [Elysia crispata]